MIPDLTDRGYFPPFLELPEDDGRPAPTTTPGSGSEAILLAQVKDNMTITKPTLVLTDREGTGFALVFDGLERDGLDLGKMGLKKGATAIIRNARRTVPVDNNGGDSLTAKAARRPFMRVAPGQAHTVLAVPTGVEQTVAIAGKLRAQQHMAETEGHERCGACNAAGSVNTATTGTTPQTAPDKKLLKCTGCGQAWYCDRVGPLRVHFLIFYLPLTGQACQTKGWSDGHKGECKALKALTAIWSE